VKRLIVTADDVGIDPGMTAGAIDAHRNGIVTACSIVANGAAFEDAVAALRGVPSLEVGAHIALVEERALSTGERMPANYMAFIARYLTGRASDAWIERETRCQLERSLAAGLRLRFVNGHQHLHALPRVFAILVRLAQEYGIGYVRVPRERRVGGLSLRAASVRALGAIADYASRRNPALDARNEWTIGIENAGHLDTTTIIRLLDDVEDVTELVTHPGADVRGYAHWNYAWTRETAALCDPAVRSAIQSRGIELTKPSDLSL
jgi:chitin disaccharide deacetylase